MSGTIAYKNETTGYFHAQLEYWGPADSIFSDKVFWTFDSVQSRLNLNQPVKNVIIQLFENLPFIKDFDWQATRRGGGPIADLVIHLHILTTFTDGTEQPVSITYEQGEIRDHTSGVTNQIGQATNAAEVLGLIRAMLAHANTTFPTIS